MRCARRGFPPPSLEHSLKNSEYPGTNLLYTVFDLETTGIGSEDRIVEIGLVQFDEQGREVRAYETLIHPQRAVPNSSFHGIDTRMVEDAPLFREVANLIEDFLASSDVVMAFNISLDWRMLGYEFSRLKKELPQSRQLCLTSHFRTVSPQAPRRLKDLCAFHDVALFEPNHSLARAQAIHRVLGKFLDSLPSDPSETKRPKSVKVSKVRSYTRHDCPETARTSLPILERLTSRLPRHENKSSFDAYFQLLDDVCADSVLEPKEAVALFLRASELGMSREETERAHRAYVQGLLELAYQDGFYTEMEAEHLEAVAAALKVQDLVRGDGSEALSLYPRDLAGKSTCFSGQPRGTLKGRRISLSQLKKLAEEAGLKLRGSVTKDLDFLVVTDPKATTGELSEAKRLGVPLVSEQVFWNWLGVQVL
jgi:DNA polymerase III subunit epsilon